MKVNDTLDLTGRPESAYNQLMNSNEIHRIGTWVRQGFNYRRAWEWSVTIIRDGKFVTALGPFETKADARVAIERYEDR